MARLYAPDGALIVSTLEIIPGTCGINDHDVTQNEDGTYNFDYDGSGTDVLWDGQETVKRQGQRVFIDEDGGEWLENELVLRDEDAV